MHRNKVMGTMLAGALLLSLLVCLGGCGGGGDSGAVAGQTGTITLEVSAVSMPADGSSSVVIKATVKDSAGNPVRHFTEVRFATTLGRFMNGGTVFTMQTQPPLDERGWPDLDADPTGIAEAALIADTRPGSAKVTVTSNNVSQSVYITMTGGAVAISLAADPLQIPADGLSASSITATITDANGLPVTPGTAVTFSTSLGTFQNGETTCEVATSGSAGTATVSLMSATQSGSALVSAESNGVTQSVYVGFGGAPVAIGVTAEPASIWADGQSSSVIQATLTDALGGPVTPGTQVTFITNLGRFANGSATYTVCTLDTTGIVTASLMAGNTTGTACVTVTANGVSQSVYVSLVEKGGTPFCMTLSADPDSIAADGYSSLKITAALADSLGNPVDPGTQVTFSTTLGKFSNNEKTYTVTTPDLTGTVSVSLISGTTSGTALIRATASGVTQSVYVVFSGSGVTLTIAAVPTSLPEDGTADITVTVTDSASNPLPGAPVDITIVEGSGTLSPAPPWNTGTDGKATGTFTLIGKQSVRLRAESMGASAEAAINWLRYTFDMNADPASIQVGGRTSRITALLQENGIPVSGQTVTFATTLGTVAPLQQATGRDGKATTILTSGDETGTATVTGAVTVGGSPLSASTTVSIGGPASETAGIFANTTGSGFPAQVAIGMDESSIKETAESLEVLITALVLDEKDNPVPDDTAVHFAVEAVGFNEDRDHDGIIDCWDSLGQRMACPPRGARGFGRTWFSDDVNQDGAMFSLGGPMARTEDANQNGILDSGEDRNANGVLDPIQTCTIVNAALTQNGVARTALTYPRNQAGNIAVRITVLAGAVSNFSDFILPCTQGMTHGGTCGGEY
ncbi:MAG: hypothetical protein J7M32_00435 [Deltaproteobacteria bacterium]|nr:hypothetical protein [Deltaproteobacteria bacterium]